MEYRLHDEKRALLSKEDYIRFTEIAKGSIYSRVLRG